jgi:hypothetical protein
MVAFLLSAGRLIPVVYQGMAHHRSLRTEHDSLQWSTLKDMFLSRTHSRGVTGQEYVWPEFGNYVGPILFGLAVLGVALGAVEHFWLVFALAWAFVFMLGHAGEWAPWHVLKMHVYPFKDMRVPSRFNVPVGMLLSACAGIGVDKVPRVFSRWCTRQSAVSAVRTGVMAFGLVGVGDMIAAGYPAIEDSYVGAPIDEHVKASDHLYLEGPNLAGFVDQPRQNRGRFECWDEWGFERDAPLWKGDVPQAKGKDNDVAASNVTRTQSSFTLDVDARKPGRVLLNTSYDMAWRTSAGKVVDASEQLGVDVPAGKLHLRVWYWPRGLTGGLVLTSLGVAGTLAFFLWDARRRRRSLDTPGAHW